MWRRNLSQPAGAPRQEKAAGFWAACSLGSFVKEPCIVRHARRGSPIGPGSLLFSSYLGFSEWLDTVALTLLSSFEYGSTGHKSIRGVCMCGCGAHLLNLPCMVLSVDFGEVDGPGTRPPRRTSIPLRWGSSEAVESSIG